MAEQQASSGGERDPRSARGAQHGELPHAPAPNLAWRATLRSRILTAAAFFVLWTVGIQARLVYLQVIDHADMQARADRQHMRTITAPAKRGEIVDRNGQMLAYSVDADSVFADPSEIENPDKVAQLVCGALDDCSARERQEMAQSLRRDTQFAYLARKVSPDEAQRVKALELKGVGFIKESRRYYPKKELAAHVLGYVGLDNTGLAGLESTYDPQVRGREGKILVQTDARRHALNSRVDRPATEGAALELTIDQNLQYIAERELRVGVEENRAAGGSAVIMDPSHRRDPRARQLADLQPEHLRPGRRPRAAQPRHPGPLRARIDVQDRHRIRGARRARDPARRLGRLRPGLHQDWQPQADPRRPSLRHALVHRRHRQVQQRRRDQGRAAARARAARALRHAATDSARR